MSTCFLGWAVPCDVTLLIALEAVAFFSVFFFVCLGNSFSGCCTHVHHIWVPWGKLLYWGSSRVLGPLILLPSFTSPEEGVSGHISCCWRWPGCGGSILGSLKTLDQDIIPLLCLGCFCPLLETLRLLEFDAGLCKTEGHFLREESNHSGVVDIDSGVLSQELEICDVLIDIASRHL